jgi:hypothetical protein
VLLKLQSRAIMGEQFQQLLNQRDLSTITKGKFFGNFDSNCADIGVELANGLVFPRPL